MSQSKMETNTISICCKAGVDELEDGKYECWDCGKVCEVEEVCADCGGTGEVDTMEQVYANEPHMAPIGTRKCICRLQSNDDDHDQDN